MDDMREAAQPPDEQDEAVLLAMLDNPHLAERIAAIAGDEGEPDDTDLHDPDADFTSD